MFKKIVVNMLSSAIVASMLLSPLAVFAAEQKCDVQISDESTQELPFEDVGEADWFYESVAYNYWGKLMTGMDETHFGPYDTLSRAQFAVILYRMNGEPDVSYTDKFPDVPADTWYTDAILWAADTGVVTGYIDTGMFGPADMITREQMAVMMYRYGTYQKYDTGNGVEFDTFLDAASVSPYAEDAMSWAVGNGIITGKNEGTMLDPQGNAARAECAAIIMRFMEKYKEPEDLVPSVDLSEDMVALMANYMPNVKMTRYGGLTVTGITVNAKADGVLFIGTAKVSDVILSRKYAYDCKAEMTEYKVEKGPNTITLELDVAENETIILGGNGSVGIYYLETPTDVEDGIFSLLDGERHNDLTQSEDEKLDLSVDVNLSESALKKHLADLQEKEDQLIREIKLEELIEYTSGKNFSILADSISTYRGYSNDAANTNSTIGNNAIWYPQNYLNNVQETWWMQLVNQMDMNLLVNNSWSGSRVLDTGGYLSRAGYNTRPVNLHDNTGADAGTTPDIVAVFMGINDFDFDVPMGTYSEELHDSIISSGSYKTPTNFTEAYIIMLDKIYNEYDGVEVFCFTLLPNSVKTDYAALEEYNETIKSIAEYYDAGIVDLYNDSGITASNFKQYTGDGLHPNATGMDMLTETFVNAMINKYTD